MKVDCVRVSGIFSTVPDNYYSVVVAAIIALATFCLFTSTVEFMESNRTWDLKASSGTRRWKVGWSSARSAFESAEPWANYQTSSCLVALSVK